jgi:hypothetical protein
MAKKYKTGKTKQLPKKFEGRDKAAVVTRVWKDLLHIVNKTVIR